MRQLINYHVKSSPDEAQAALNKKLTELWLQSRNKNTSQEYLILFEYGNQIEYGNQKTLLKAEFPKGQQKNDAISAPFIKISHDDLLGRPANKTIKDGIEKFQRDNNIKEVIFLDVNLKNIMQHSAAFLSGIPNARVNVDPIERENISAQEIQAAKNELAETFPKLKLNEIEIENLLAARKTLSNVTELFTNYKPQKLVPSIAEATKENVFTKQPGK